MNILVTGAAGNIGGELTSALVGRKDTFVVAVDNLLTGKLSKLPPQSPNLRFVKADVNNHNDIAEIMLAYRFDYVFHYAAVVGVARTLENPLMVLNDINGIRNILDLSRNTSVKRVFYSSSSEVYGEPVEFPQNENTTPLNSRLPYAVVKNLGESFLRAFHKEYGLDYTIFRFFNTYGPRQSDDFVIGRFIRLAMEGKDLVLNGGGNQTRTFCYIQDNIDVTLKVLFDQLCVNDVMNVGNDQEVQIVDLARKIVRLLGSSSKIVHAPALTEGDMARRQPDITKMKGILGRPLIDLDEGILRTAKSLKVDKST